MKIILAPDSFKDSLSAPRVCEAMANGIRRVISNADIVQLPLADGGEGTVQALVVATGGSFKNVEVTGPLGESVNAQYGFLGDGETAVIEMAAASGLEMLPKAKRNPLHTSTVGTGQMIRDALERGMRRIFIGIGGSATTDGGCGMAQALGVRFFNVSNQQIMEPMTGDRMGIVRRIDLSGLHPAVCKSEFRVLCDVANPLLGPDGSARVYGPQKGASPADVEILEQNMTSVFDVIESEIGHDVRHIPGAGAAGGLGAGLMAFLNAKLESGIELILDAIHFYEKSKNADLILTGEGRVDHQTAFGKTIAGVAGAGKALNIPVIVLAGSIGSNIENLYDTGVTSVFAICDESITLEESMNRAAELVANETERVIRFHWIKGEG